MEDEAAMTTPLPPCTGTCTGEVYAYLDLPCGCQDVIYTDGSVCIEHNHVQCDGEPIEEEL
jgi:hypothetical protein